jgi:glycosyltransferase involved in cell wall biosynthesis
MVYPYSVNNTEKKRVAIVSIPWASNAPYKFLSDLISILDPICKNILIIDGNTSRISYKSDILKLIDINISLHYAKEKKLILFSHFIWIVKCFIIQAAESWTLFKYRKEYDIVFFYIAYPYFLLPLLTSKILNKKTVEILTRSKSNSRISKLASIQDIILYQLLDKICLESPSLIINLNEQNYKKIMNISGARYINSDRFRITKKYEERKFIIGFVGRIIKEKGILEFLEAIPLLIDLNQRDISFLIIGSGDLDELVKSEARRIQQEYGVQITVTGWVNEELPLLLNEMKVMVLPTHSDAFPTIILEAMACGTPVLASPIGGIPDIIKNGETGFFLEDNSPECIAKNLKNIEDCGAIHTIIENSKNLIFQEYTFIKAVMRFDNILKEISK